MSIFSRQLARATVQNSKTGQLETASYRISKSAWLKHGEHPLVDQVMCWREGEAGRDGWMARKRLDEELTYFVMT